MPKKPTKRAKTARKAKNPTKRGPKDGQTFSQAKILQIAQEHPDLSQNEIAAVAGVERSTVSRTLSRYGADLGLVEEYKAHRADVFAAMQEKLIASCTAGDVNKATLMQRMASVGILYDKERIERGLSDQGTAPLVVIQIRSDRATIADNQPISPSIMLPPSQDVIDVK
jgi:predicted DNA-binding protein YlxM (UPF0122 family)